jgi:hypothetical protein
MVSPFDFYQVRFAITKFCIPASNRRWPYSSVFYQPCCDLLVVFPTDSRLWSRALPKILHIPAHLHHRKPHDTTQSNAIQTHPTTYIGLRSDWHCSRR